MFSTPVFPFWIKRATTPATRGADTLVPDPRIVPPPFCNITMPTEEMPQVEVIVSESSPGAEIVIPMFVVGLNAPSLGGVGGGHTPNNVEGRGDAGGTR